MQFAGETACATNGKSFGCDGGAGFSLLTPECGRIFRKFLGSGPLETYGAMGAGTDGYAVGAGQAD